MVCGSGRRSSAFSSLGEGGGAWSAGFTAGRPGARRNKREFAQKLLAYCILEFFDQTLNPAASALFQSSKEIYSEIRRDTLFFRTGMDQTGRRPGSSVFSAVRSFAFEIQPLSGPRFGAISRHLLSEPEERILRQQGTCRRVGLGRSFRQGAQPVSGSERRTGAESEVLGELYSAEREVRKFAASELSEGLRSILLV